MSLGRIASSEPISSDLVRSRPISQGDIEEFTAYAAKNQPDNYRAMAKAPALGAELKRGASAKLKHVDIAHDASAPMLS